MPRIWKWAKLPEFRPPHVEWRSASGLALQTVKGKAYSVVKDLLWVDVRVCLAALLAAGLVGVSLGHPSIREFGLIGKIHPLFFVGASLPTLYVVMLGSPQRRLVSWTVVGAVAVFLYAFTLAGLPLLFGGSQPVLWHKYMVYKWVDYISSTGRLNPTLFDYHRYPLSFVLVSMIVQVLGFPKPGSDPYLFLELFPPVMTVLWLVVLGLFFRAIPDVRGSSWIPLALWIFVLGVWDNFAAVGAQSAGYLGFLVALAIIARSYNPSRPRWLDAPTRVLLVISSVGISLMHLLSGLLTLGLLTGVVAHDYVSRRDTRLVGPAILLGSLLLAWLMTGASEWLSRFMHIFVEHAFRLVELFRVGLVDRIRMSGNDMTRFVAIFRICYSMAFVFLGISGALVRVRSDSRGFSLLLAMFLPLLLTVALMGTTYGGEIVDRGYYAVLPLLAYFATWLALGTSSRVLLVAFLILGTPGYVLSRHGHLPADYLSGAYRSGLRFFSEHGAPSGSLAGNVDAWGYWVFRDTYSAVPRRSELIIGYVPLPTFVKNYASYRGVLLEDLFQEVDLVKTAPRDFTPPLYIGISSHTRAIYERTLGESLFLDSVERTLVIDPAYGRFYSNGDTDLYIAESGFS